MEKHDPQSFYSYVKIISYVMDDEGMGISKKNQFKVLEGVV